MHNEKNYIMWLNSLLNINIEVKNRLIDYFGSCQDIWEADRKLIENSKILNSDKVDYIIESRYRYDIDKELEKLYHIGADFITSEDKNYPLNLGAMEESPLGLFVLGEMPKRDTPMVSIVGSRRISDYGATVCDKIGRELAKVGVVVVSGMAMGVDAVAHKGCIESGGKTIAVLGTGVDVCYPAVNTNLYRQIQNNGCVISEFPLGTKAFKYNFPYRNRIIAGLSDVTVVIEAAEKSGSLITANKALEYGRKVMAVPGNITSALSKGCNLLIKKGCSPVTEVEDILKELNIQEVGVQLKISQKNTIPLAEDEKMLYDCISYEPITFDELVGKLNMDTKMITSMLTMLELKGYIKRLSGQKVVRSL